MLFRLVHLKEFTKLSSSKLHTFGNLVFGPCGHIINKIWIIFFHKISHRSSLANYVTGAGHLMSTERVCFLIDSIIVDLSSYELL